MRKYTLLLFLFLSLSLTGGIIWLITTESGFIWLADKAQQWAPGELTIAQVQGRLVDKFQIKDLTYQYQELAIRFSAFQFAWQAKALTHSTVHISQFHLNGLRLHLPATQESPPSNEPFSLPDIRLPIRIILEDVKIRDISVQIAENKATLIESVDLITTTQEQIQLQHFSVKSPQFQVTLAGKLAFQPPYPLQLELTWSAQLPNHLPAAGQGTLTGNIKHLVLSHALHKPTPLQAKITVDEILGNLRWLADLHWETLQWPLSTEKTLIVQSQHAQAQLEGTLENYRVILQTDLSGPQIPAGQWTIKAHGDLQTLTIEDLQAKLLNGIVNASGQINWYPDLQAQLHLQAEGLTVEPYWTAWPADLTIATQLKATFKDQQINVDQWQIRIPEVGTDTLLRGNIALAEKIPKINATLTWEKLQWPLSGQLPTLTSAQGHAEVKGTLENYQVNLASQLTTAQLSGQLSTTVRGNLSQVTVEKLQAELLEGTLQASGQVAWKDTLNAQFKLRTQRISPQSLLANWPADLSVNTQLEGEWSGQTLKISDCHVTFPQIATQFSLQGESVLTTAKPQFKATLNWQALQWPFTGISPMIHSTQGTLNARGTPDTYQFTLNTDLTGQNIPASRWQATGKGDLQSVQFTQLKGNLLQGLVNLTGQIHWQPTVAWQIALNGQEINPAHYLAELPGKLAFTLESQGELHADGVHTQVAVKNMQGTLRDYPVTLQTHLTLAGTHLAVKNLQFYSGKARVTLDGKLFPQADVKWMVDAPNLTHLLPQIQGQLNAQGQLTGDLKTPHLVADLQGHHLIFETNHLGSVEAHVSADLAMGKEAFKINLMVNDVAQGTLQVNKVQLTAQGTLVQHTLETQVTLPRDTLKLQLAGHFDREQLRWQGQLAQLAVTSADFGHWQTTHPTDLVLSPQQVELAQHCLQYQKTQLCTQARWQKQADSLLQVTLTELPVGIAKAFLPPDLQVEGTIDGNLFATLQADGTLRSTAKVNLSKGYVQGHFSEVLDTIPYQGGTLQLAITEQGLTAEVEIGLLEQSKIQGTLALPRLTRFPLPDPQPVTGRIQADFADLQLLPLFSPQITHPKGKVNADVLITGELAKPQIEGLVQVQNGSLELPDFGLDLKDLQVTIKGNNQANFQAQGQVRSGKGILRLTGQASKNTSAHWEAKLTLVGKQVEVANMPSAWVLAEPNIEVHILPKHVNVKGTVTIPQATITPSGGATSAITVSEDVVIVNPKEPAKPSVIEEKLAITSQLQVILGDKVTFEGMGLKARLQGSLVVSNRPNKETIGRGELQIVEGTYKDYGQNLQIDRGRIIFTGGPVTNPGLDMRAVRHIKQDKEEDIMAGLRIQGTAKSPQVSLFSQPTFDQTNTLSYILLGKPAAQASEGEGQLLVNAVSSLPLKRGDNITKQIANQFGFDEASISSEGGIEEAALVLGKYLSPRLYISYGIGLFENMNVFRIRYDLTKRLKLETETGTQSGVDLHYTVEW